MSLVCGADTSQVGFRGCWPQVPDRQEGRRQAWQEVSKDETLVWGTSTLGKTGPSSEPSKKSAFSEGEQRKPEELEGPGWSKGGRPRTQVQ